MPKRQSRPKGRVLLLYNLPWRSGAGAESDAGVLDEVKAVEEALARRGRTWRTVGVGSARDLPRLLAAAREAVVFNLVEGLPNETTAEALLPVLCRVYGKACTGNNEFALALALDKWRTKAVLRAAGLPVPPGVLVPVGARLSRAALPGNRGGGGGPYIVKPLATDASEGIDAHSVIPRAGPALARAVAEIHRAFHQPALVEQFVGERELNVSVIVRRGRPEVLPAAEIDFSTFGAERPRIVGYTAKWHADSFEYRHTPPLLPAPLSARLAARVRAHALAAWSAVGCSDYARVDLRLADEEPFLLEVNPNPDIAPEAGFAAALGAAGISYETFIAGLLENAVARARR